MGSSKFYITSSGLKIRQVNLCDPDKEKIAHVLDEALKRNYTKASVEWVTFHPDLYQPHFNLAASGICGNTALLDFNDMSCVKLPISERKIYYFENFLKDIGRDNKDSFIFGHGIYQNSSCYRLREFVLNTSFLPSTDMKERESRNNSQFINYDQRQRCKPEKLSLYELKCTVQGTYFLCDGSRTNASVLKVRAKQSLLTNVCLLEKKGFINLMQKALEEKFGSDYFVALGGVYTINTVNNVPWKHRLYRNNWENRINIDKKYCQINSPETVITIFNNTTEFQPTNSRPPIELNSSKSIHSLSHHSASLNFPVFDLPNMGEEYVGYFCPATTLYRIY